MLYGRGDPTFGKRCFATDTLREGACETDSFTRLRELADGLRKRGVREIRGDLVGDGSWFEPLTVHPGWETFDVNWWYAAPVTGLGFNDNSVDFAWGPGTRPARRRSSPCRPTWATWRSRTGPSPCRPGGALRHRRPVLPRAGHAQRLGRGHGRARQADADRVVRDARPEPLHRARLPAGAAGGGDRDHGHHPLDHRFDALPPGAEHAAAGGDHVAPAARVDLPDPQPEPELVRRDGPQAARPPVRPRRDRGPRGSRSSAGS